MQVSALQLLPNFYAVFWLSHLANNYIFSSHFEYYKVIIIILNIYCYFCLVVLQTMSKSLAPKLSFNAIFHIQTLSQNDTKLYKLLETKIVVNTKTVRVSAKMSCDAISSYQKMDKKKLWHGHRYRYEVFSTLSKCPHFV